MEYRLLASDLDNTLVPFGEGRPRKETVQAVCAMQEKGVGFVVASGRCCACLRGTAKPLTAGISPDYYIGANGAEVMDAAGHYLYERTMTSEEMYALVDFCEDYGYALEFAFRDGYYAYVDYARMASLCNRPGTGIFVMDGEDRDHHLQGMPYSAFLFFPRDGVERFQKKYGHLGLNFQLSMASDEQNLYAYDVAHESVDKAVGLAHLCERLGVPMAQAVAAGDGFNDCGMLEKAGLGCAMSNAADCAKQAADRVIGDVRENGLGALIGELWLGGPKARPSSTDFGAAPAVLV